MSLHEPLPGLMIKYRYDDKRKNGWRPNADENFPPIIFCWPRVYPVCIHTHIDHALCVLFSTTRTARDCAVHTHTHTHTYINTYMYTLMEEIGLQSVEITHQGSYARQNSSEPRGGFLKIICVGIPTYAGMKTGFHAYVSPKNRFSCRRRSECQLE